MQGLGFRIQGPGFHAGFRGLRGFRFQSSGSGVSGFRGLGILGFRGLKGMGSRCEGSWSRGPGEFIIDAWAPKSVYLHPGGFHDFVFSWDSEFRFRDGRGLGVRRCRYHRGAWGLGVFGLRSWGL